ncbi:hypothetical protein EDC94DRAFT_597522 [Helicostylum pulchrum]|nr:hypothetical protein EDC94DRAFT_597522 [Helicostylum pulchrum]
MVTEQLVYNYPHEIFDHISCYLTNRQKGVCRTVCQSWRLLFTPSQYRHIQVRGRIQFYQFLQALASGVGHYVKRLSVDDVYMTAMELESLPYLCPNLVSLSFNGKSLDTAGSVTSGKELLDNPFSQWKYLRHLTELQDLSVAYYLLNTPYSPLTHLSIRLQLKNKAMKTDFFTSLHKATKLESLSLDSISLSLSEMEAIHNACPRLQNIRLINANLEPIGNSVVKEKRCISAVRHFDSARHMKSFELQNGTGLYENYEWLYYIGTKYPNLTHVQLWCAYSVNTPSPDVLPTDDELREKYEAIASIGTKCHDLKSASFMNVLMNHWLFEEMDNVGTKLESITLGDMTDNTIGLLQCLIRSKQNVKSLTLWGWTSLCIQETMEETVVMIGQCSDRLSSFTFSMQFSGVKNAPIPLNLLLSKCPKLKYLKFDNIQATLMCPKIILEDYFGDNDSRFIKPQLQHLVFENGSFRNEIFKYLSLNCASLEKLDIGSCALIGEYYAEMDIKIHMPHHTFKCISIKHARPPSHYYHVKQASDIRFFDVLLSKEPQSNGLYELKGYETFNSSLTFEYEQKPLEYSRPTKYINHQNTSDVNQQPSSPFVSIQCHALTELNIGDFWII